MYTSFFGFSEKPFDVTPDPKFLYLNEAYREVLASLIYGIRERRGFIAVVGEVGTGKTTLLNALLDRLNEKTNVAYIFNTDVTFEQLLDNILVELGLIKGDETVTRQQALERLNRFAIQQLAKGYNIALIVDEAQNLDYPTMESLRLLSNLETRKLKLIQIILSGQPELDSKLNDPRLRQLAQRISLKRHIVPLNEKETYEYIQHRLAIAGCKRSSLFDRKAKQLIWNYSEGIPRKISILCDNAFLIAYGLKKRKISEDVAAEAIKDLTWSPFSEKKEAAIPLQAEPPPESPDKSPSRLTFAGVVSIIVASLILFASGLWFGKNIFFTKTEKVPFSENLVRARVEKQPPARPENIIEPAVPKPFANAVPGEEKPGLSLKRTARAEAPPPESAMEKFPEPVKEAAETAVRESPVDTPAVLPAPLKTAGRDPSKKLEAQEKISDAQRPEAPWKKARVGDPQKKDRPSRVALVRRGDTLYRIILRAYGDYTRQILGRVLKHNPEIGDPDKIFVGQKIELPGEKSGNES
jgi:general secretion pathway protein A